MMAVGDGLLAAAADIAAESGQEVSAVQESLQEMRRTVDDMIRRVLIVAERR